MKNKKTPLEKSHSAWSNTKLTLLSLFTALCTSVFWLSLVFLSSEFWIYALATLLLSLFGTLFCLYLFRNFKR